MGNAPFSVGATGGFTGGDDTITPTEHENYLTELVEGLGCLQDGERKSDTPDNVQGGYQGGHAVGGIDDLTREYDTTVSSKGKKELIKKITVGISKALKVAPPGSNASADDMVAHLMKIVPNPRKGKSIIANKEKQAKLCRDVADVINKSYGNVIDKSLGADGICNQVSDIVESLSAGMRQEFVAVSASVQRALQNLLELKEMMSRSYSKLLAEIRSSSDSGLKLRTEGIESLHKLILDEVNRQIAILSNLTSTNLKSTSNDLAKLLAENKDFKGLVSSIKYSLGTSEWGDKLGFWLSGINTTAQMANAVEKALKVIGMKVSDYKNYNKLSNLTMKTHSLMEKLPANKLTRSMINQFESAVDILKRHHGHHKKISKHLKSGGYFGGDGHWDSLTARIDDPAVSSETQPTDSVEGGYVKLSKKLKSQGNTRRIMLKDFKSKAKILMDRVYNSIFSVGRAIGDGKIKLSDDLNRFKIILGDMSLVFREGVEYALTGYYNHANAVEHKERFLGLLRAMLDILESLKGQNEQFRELVKNVEEMLKLVDFYNDKFKIHTGYAASDRPSVQGGGEFRAAVTLRNARNSFNHFYNIAKFKSNLKQVAAEMGTYNKDYDTVVGAAVGKEIDVARREFNRIKTELENASSGPGKSINHMVVNKGQSPYSDVKMDVHPQGYSTTNIIAVQESFLSAKIQLYKAAQAIDSYLQHFTDAVATSPDEVRAVARMLSSVEIMANWFNNKSGDSIAALYEIFPWSMRGFRTYHNKELQENVLGSHELTGNSIVTIPESSHYYECIGKHVRKALPNATSGQLEDSDHQALPGNPFLPISPERAVKAHRFAKYTVDKVFALKNIVSAFAYLGSRFGEKEIHKEVFMSPNQIYKALSHYMYISALTMSWNSKYTRLYGCKDDGTYIPELGMNYKGKLIGPGRNNHTNFAGGQHDASSSRLDMSSLGNAFNVGGAAGAVGGLNHTGDDHKSTFRLGAVHSVRWCCVLESDNANNRHFAGAAGVVLANGAAGNAADKAAWFNEIAGQRNDSDAFLTDKSLIAANNNTGVVAYSAKRTNLEHAGVIRNTYACSMAGIANHGDLDTGTSLSGWKDVFYKEDKIFINCIKAMAAKVFTVTGLYNMLNFADTRNYSMSPTRVILGGGAGGGKSGGDSFSYQTPKIYSDAMELYARLPLLAEFYRDIFCFEEPCDDDADTETDKTKLLISMVPEVGSMWADFIQCVFDQPVNTNGIYTENAVKRMIHAINRVYLAYKPKHPQDVVMAVIKDFVAEINSRYGLMSRTEIEQYKTDEETQRRQHRYGTDGNPDPGDFDTLDEDTIGTGVAPSDRFSKVTAYPGLGKDYQMTSDMYKALKVFRRRIDKRIRTVSFDNPGEFHLRKSVPDFSALIMSSKESLKTVENPEEHLKITMRMMTGMDTKTQTNREQYVMFHESIVTPLATLSAITQSLKQYEKCVREWDAYALFKGLEKTWNPVDYTNSKCGQAWKLWIQSKFNINNSPDTYKEFLGADQGQLGRHGGVGAASTATDYQHIGYSGTTMCHTEMKKHVDVNSESETIIHKIAQNLWRSIDEEFPTGYMGLGASMTLQELVESLDLSYSRYVSTESRTLPPPAGGGLESPPTLRIPDIAGVAAAAAAAPGATPASVATAVRNLHAAAAVAANAAAAAADANNARLDAIAKAPTKPYTESIKYLKEHAKGFEATNDEHYGMHRHIAYATIRWNALFKHMLSLVYGLTNNLGKLCEFNFSNNRLTLNHTKLQMLCEEVMATVRRDIDKFRGVVSNDIIKRYEDFNTPGSINWLQQNLFDSLFKDRDKRGLKRAHNIVTKNFQLLGNVYPDNTAWKCTYFGLVNITPSGSLQTPPVFSGVGRIKEDEVLTSGWSIEEVFAEESHYNSRTMSSKQRTGLEITGPARRSYGVNDGATPGVNDPESEPVLNFANPNSLIPVWTHYDAYEYLMKDADKSPNSSGRKFSHHLFKARHDFKLQNNAGGETDGGFRGDTFVKQGDRNVRTMYRSTGSVEQNDHSKSDVGEGLMMKFNEVMSAYIRQFWDVSSNKIYAPLIDAPANGPFNQEVFKAQGWPDLTAPILSVQHDKQSTEGPWSNLTRFRYTNPAVNANGGETRVQRWAQQAITRRSEGRGEWFVPMNYDSVNGEHRSNSQGVCASVWSMLTPGNNISYNIITQIVANKTPFNKMSRRVKRYIKRAQSYQRQVCASICGDRGTDSLPYKDSTAANDINTGVQYWARSINTPEMQSKYSFRGPNGVATNLNMSFRSKQEALSPAGPLNKGGPATWNGIRTTHAWGQHTSALTVDDTSAQLNNYANHGRPWCTLGNAFRPYGSNSQKDVVPLPHVLIVRKSGKSFFISGWNQKWDKDYIMPDTGATNHAAWVLGMKYLLKLKRTLINKSRELDKFDPGTLRIFVYNYIRKVLGDQIYDGEVYRLETIVKLQEGLEDGAQKPYPTDGKFPTKLLRKLYGDEIDRNARMMKAYLIEKWLEPFATNLFAQLAEEIQLGEKVYVADAMALTGAMSTPCSGRFSQITLAYVTEISRKSAAIPTYARAVEIAGACLAVGLNPRTASDINANEIGWWGGAARLPVNAGINRGSAYHLSLLRTYYAAGGTCALGDMSLLFADGEMSSVASGAALATPAAKARYNKLYKSLVEYNDEFEGRIKLESVWGVPGTAFLDEKGVNLDTGKYDQANFTDDVFRVDTNCTADTLFKLIGCGFSNMTPLAAGYCYRNIARHQGAGGAHCPITNYVYTSTPRANDQPARSEFRAVYPSCMDFCDLSSILPPAGPKPSQQTVTFINGDRFANLGGIMMNCIGLNEDIRGDKGGINRDGNNPTLATDFQSMGITGTTLADNPQSIGDDAVGHEGALDILTRVLMESSRGYLAIESETTPKSLKSKNHSEGGLQEISRFSRHIGDPKEILFASTAKAIRTALTENGKLNEKSNIIQSIAEVPIRMKESLKAQLPLFSELFGMIGKKADLLKGAVRLNVGLDRSNGVCQWSRMEEKGVHGSVYSHRRLDHKEAREYYTQLLDKVSIGCSSMVSATTAVMNELNDVPLYLETAENSIVDYKNANGKMPLMPLSSMSSIFQSSATSDNMQTHEITDNSRGQGKQLRVPIRDPQLGYPVEGPGSELFSYNYGTRSLLHDYGVNPMIEHMPGMKEIVELYNTTSHGQKKMEPKTFGTYVGKVVSLMRYIHSSRLYSPLFGADRRVVDRSLYLQTSSDMVLRNPPLQSTLALSDTMSLTTSSDRDNKMGDIVGFLMGSQVSSTPVSRKHSMIYNILDLNISPINVHAMRKELALANLYNYAYTFDSFVTEIVQSSVDEPVDIKPNATTHDILAGLLKHPYMVMSDGHYYGKLNEVMHGKSSVDLYGYPKFISDQLLNKVLLGELNTGNHRRRQDAGRLGVNMNGYNNAWHSQNNDFQTNMHYLTDDQRGQTKRPNIVMNSDGGGHSAKGYLSELGRLRFDTKFVRNLFFLANVQRIMTHKIENELSKIHTPVASNAAVTNRRITDYHDRETYNDLRID